MLPLFKHDCEECIFLGTYEHRDLYFCNNHSDSENATIITRYGDEDGMYGSGLCFIYSVSPYYVECAERAVALELLDPNSSTGGFDQGTVQEEIDKRRSRS